MNVVASASSRSCESLRERETIFFPAPCWPRMCLWFLHVRAPERTVRSPHEGHEMDILWSFSHVFPPLTDGSGSGCHGVLPKSALFKAQKCPQHTRPCPPYFIFFFYLIGILHPRIILGDEQFAGYISFYPSILHYWMYFMASRLNFHSCSSPWSLSPQLWSLGCKMQAKQTFIRTVTE